MELSYKDFDGNISPNALKLAGELIAKNWEGDYYLIVDDPTKRHFIEGISLKEEMAGVLSYFEQEKVSAFRLNGYSHDKSENDFRQLTLKFLRDEQTGFWLDKIELSNLNNKSLSMSIPYGNYLPERNRLLRRFEDQRLERRPFVILPRKALRRMMNNDGEKGMEP